MAPRLPLYLRIFFVGLTIFLVLSSGALTALAAYHHDRYYPGVRVAGIRLGSLSHEEGIEKIKERVGEYRNHAIVVTLPDIAKPRDEKTGDYPDIEIKTTAAELGLSFDEDAALSTSWEVGRQKNPWQWAKSALPAYFVEDHIPLGYSVDSTQVRTFIDTKIIPQITNPIPAKLHAEGDQVIIDDPKPGVEVDTEALEKQLAASLPTVMDGDTTYLRAPVKQTNSEVTRNDLQPFADKINSLGNLSITLTAENNKAYHPSRTELLKWFTVVQDESGKVSLDIDEKAVTNYVEAQKVDRIDKDKSITALLATLKKSVEEQAKTSEVRPLAAQTVALAQKAQQTSEVTAGDFTPGIFPGKYVLVNLKEQKLYRAEGDNLIKTYRVSTGKWSTPTPKGTFHIVSKTTRAYSKTFGLYMPYWMNFVGTPDGSNQELQAGEYGLHELPEWPNGYKEGQSHIGTPVSHGCIRLGVGDAEEIYNWGEVGMPVIVR